jgi:hypothetical protein
MKTRLQFSVEEAGDPDRKLGRERAAVPAA